MQAILWPINTLRFPASYKSSSYPGVYLTRRINYEKATSHINNASYCLYLRKCTRKPRNMSFVKLRIMPWLRNCFCYRWMEVLYINLFSGIGSAESAVTNLDRSLGLVQWFRSLVSLLENSWIITLATSQYSSISVILILWLLIEVFEQREFSMTVPKSVRWDLSHAKAVSNCMWP